MILHTLSILNYKNLEHVEMFLSPNVNCLIGRNGMGKTNILDAVYYLSFCKSSGGALDAQNIRHGEDFFMIQGRYVGEGEDSCDVVSCGVKRGQRKRVRRNDKEYKRLAEHIGLIPLVMISPSDSLLISGGSEERRRFLDMVISQYDVCYLETVMRYNKMLQQRNALLKQEATDDGLYEVIEEMLSADARIIYERRLEFVRRFLPIFREMYARLCDNEHEEVGITYVSHGERGELRPMLQGWRERERIVGYTLHGVHKDNLELTINGYPVRREGSQGQSKTYFIAMKLAQFLFLKTMGERRVPILLLDDIFDKLDAGRVARIIEYVSGDDFGQIFVTDTNREHLDRILEATHRDYRLFVVENGAVRQ